MIFFDFFSNSWGKINQFMYLRNILLKKKRGVWLKNKTNKNKHRQNKTSLLEEAKTHQRAEENHRTQNWLSTSDLQNIYPLLMVEISF